MTAANPVLSIHAPDDLTRCDQWVLWHYEGRDGKPTKVPYQLNGAHAATDDPQTWNTFAAVACAWTKAPKRYSGVGFVFSESDPFAGIDLDNCLDEDGAVKPWARQIIEKFRDSYAEVSPSGRGIKIFVRGHLDGPGKRVPYQDGAVEVYDRGRYFTVTGMALEGAPLQVTDHQEEISSFAEQTAAAAPAARPKAKADLWDESPIPEGKRYEYLQSLSGQFRVKGMNGPEIYAALSAVNATRCKPPKDDAVLRELAGWAATLEPGNHGVFQRSVAATPESPEGAADHANLLSGFEPEDVGNGQRLIAMYGTSIRYCHSFKKWLVWSSHRWEAGEGDRVMELTHRTMTEFAIQAIKANNEAQAKFAVGCRRAARIANAIQQARPYLAIKPEVLDTHPDLLNFQNGTVDLKTGALGPHRREDFITKLVHYDYQPHAECPTFLTFLKRITSNHPGLIDYLQMAFGYSLTGHTIEKAVFLLHGRGDNGKSTLLSTFLKLLEEYAVLLQIDTLMTRQESNNTQADLADLRGARFVMTSETEEGQRLAEGKLKRITQGMGRIKATRKYENPGEFSESHKLWIDANHLPVIRGTDNAIWNRLHPVPFDTTIPKDEQDKALPDKLASEAEGILAWAVAGAARWYAEGLGKPSDVQQAGESWRTQADQIGRFIAEVCIVGDYAQVNARALYSAYKRWTEDAGEHPVTETVFGLRIAEDYAKKHTKTGAVYGGIGLRCRKVTGDG